MSKHLIAITATAMAVTGCATQRPPAPVATEDLNVGIAKTCTPSPVDFSSGPSTSASIAMTNDGWCSIHTKDKDGQPFKFGLVKAKSLHGRILIQKIGGETRVEYTPENRFVGVDRFSVALASNAPSAPDSTVQVTVNIGMGEGMAPAATTPVAETRRAPTARRPAPRRTGAPTQAR